VPLKKFFASDTVASSGPEGSTRCIIFYQNCTKTPDTSTETEDEDEGEERHSFLKIQSTKDKVQNRGLNIFLEIAFCSNLYFCQYTNYFLAVIFYLYQILLRK
jgi:hypothetical protein